MPKEGNKRILTFIYLGLQNCPKTSVLSDVQIHIGWDFNCDYLLDSPEEIVLIKMNIAKFQPRLSEAGHGMVNDGDSITQEAEAGRLPGLYYNS
jgi:hypothetical protein